MFKVKTVDGIYQGAVKDIIAVKEREEAIIKKVEDIKVKKEEEHRLAMLELEAQRSDAIEEISLADAVIDNFKDLFGKRGE